MFWNCSCPVAPSSQSGFSVGMRTIRIGLPANWKQTANGKIGNLLLRSCFLCRPLILLMVFVSPHSLWLCGNLPLCPSSMQSVDDGSCLWQRKPWERRCLVTKRCVVFMMKFSVSGSVAGAAERTGLKEKTVFHGRPLRFLRPVILSDHFPTSICPSPGRNQGQTCGGVSFYYLLLASTERTVAACGHTPTR